MLHYLLQSLQYHLACSFCNQTGQKFNVQTIHQLLQLIAAIEEHYIHTSRLQYAYNQFSLGVNSTSSLFMLQTVTALSIDIADSNPEVGLGPFFPKDQSASTLMSCLVYPLAEEHQTKVLRQAQVFLPVSAFQAVLSELQTLLHPQVWVKLCSCMPEIEDYSSAFKTKSPLRVTKQLLEYIKSVTCEDKNDRAFYEETISQDWSIMQIPYDQGKFISFLVKALQVKTALELGTYTGYSSYTIVRGMGPEGKLITCDINDQWTAIARSLWECANVASQIELKVGKALDTLNSLLTTHHEEFDFIFIDCDKENYSAYFDKAIPLLKKGGVIAVDNVLWQGLVSEETTDETANIIKQFNAKVANDTKIDGLCITTIGDGLTLAIKQ